MALVGSCRTSLSAAKNWLCLASVAGANGVVASLNTSSTICEPVRCQSSISAKSVDSEEDGEIERRVERVERMPKDGPQEVAFQPIDMASLAPGLPGIGRMETPRRQQKWCELNYETLYSMMNRGNISLIDVREKTEIQKAGMIPQSINIPLSTLKQALLLDSDDFYSQYGIPKPQKHDEYVVFYSLNHVKGVTALEIAHRLGFRKARQYAGGYEDWLNKQMQFMPMTVDDFWMVIVREERKCL